MMRQKPGQDDNIDDLDGDNEEDDDLADEEEDEYGNFRREAEKFSAQLKSFLRYEKSV